VKGRKRKKGKGTRVRKEKLFGYLEDDSLEEGGKGVNIWREKVSDKASYQKIKGIHGGLAIRREGE